MNCENANSTPSLVLMVTSNDREPWTMLRALRAHPKPARLVSIGGAGSPPARAGAGGAPRDGHVADVLEPREQDGLGQEQELLVQRVQRARARTVRALDRLALAGTVTAKKQKEIGAIP